MVCWRTSTKARLPGLKAPGLLIAIEPNTAQKGGGMVRR